MIPETYVKRFAALGVMSLLLTALTAAQAARPAHAADVPPNPLEKPGWILDRHDEFDGGLDTSLWVTNYLESRTPEWRSRARYGFRNNALVLRIDGDQPTYYAGDPMKVSSIQTGQKTGLHKTSPFDHSIPTVWNYTAQYGYFEIRAKTSARSGLHAAFWTVGRQDTSTQNAEIDIMEHPGRTPRNFNYSLHKWSDPNVPETNHSISTAFDIASEMHIYALEWTPTQIKLYVDNVLTKTIGASPAYPSAFLLGIYENAGWTGSVDPTDPRPKEFVVDYFRAYRKADSGPLVSGAKYKIRNAATGRYLDSEANGGLILSNPAPYDDQDWVAEQQANGSWTIRNVRSGRYYLDSESNNVVIWNSGDVVADSQWRIEPTSGGFRVKNDRPDRHYLYGTPADAVRWNTGSTDSSTVWAFERT
jgi:beta-glucanase (GH16 family)